MDNLVGSNIGLLHLLTACLALLTGSFILWSRKGTGIHKKVGYVYAVSMLFVNGSAFGLYRLFGSFGIFHFFALVSLTSIFLGMVPKLMKWRNGLKWHINQMYFSVIGLYAAFFGELAVRLPFVQTVWWFWIAITLASVTTVAYGTYIFMIKYKNWKPSV